MAVSRKSVRPGPPERHGEATIQVPDSGKLRAVVVADTHGHMHPACVRLVRELSPDVVLHAGDIGNPEVLRPLEELAPLHAVRGNIDPRGPLALDSLALTFEFQGQRWLRVLLLHIGMYGSKLQAGARRLAAQHGCSLVVCGHSHVPFLGLDCGVGLFNPGSIGPRRFSLPITFGVFDLSPGKFAARHVCCETGQTWLPQALHP